MRGGEEIALPVDRALFDLLVGNQRRAIATLELATRDRNFALEALTDLSAAYLARFEREHDCVDLLRAVEAADRGLAIDSANASCLFNRAQALTLLGTRVAAIRAWQRVASQAEGGWNQEAAAAMRSLQRATLEDEWKAALVKIEAPGVSPSIIEEVSTQFPWNARAYVEETVLPRWADTQRAGNAIDATRLLSIASIIGATLAARGEMMIADSLQSIRVVMERGSPGDREAVLNGFQKFGIGVAALNNQQSGKEALGEAERDLERIRHPMRYWARFYLAMRTYYDLTGEAALPQLDRLLEEIPSSRYPALTGRICWIAGNIEKNLPQPRIQSSIHRYERAAENLRRAGGEPAAAFATVLLAESYALIGEEALAWQSRERAFQNVPYAGTPRNNVAMWAEASEALLRSGNGKLAAPLLEEALAAAGRWGQPWGQAVAYINRATYDSEIGRREEAQADIRRAEAASLQIEDESLRSDTDYRIQIVEGLEDLADDPARAADRLEHALSSQAAKGADFDAITYTTELARAQLAAGRTADGAATLERAVAIFESIRSTVDEPVSRMLAFKQAQPAFNRLIQLRAATPAGDREAFLLAERSRARVLLEMAYPDGGGTFATLEQLERVLPRGTALTSYVVLDDRILAWIVERGRSRRVSLPVSRSEIDEQIANFRLQLTGSSSVDAIHNASAPIYDELIRPLSLGDECESLIVVPDRSLARLPFAALFDRQSNRYLIEQRTVSVTPSATLLVRTAQRAGTSPRGSTVVFSVSRAGVYQGTVLPALTHADSEASAVAAVYPDASLLQNSNATIENFRRLSLSTAVIHFAGHAVVDLNVPRRSVLLFASNTSQSLDPLSLEALFDRGFTNANLVVLSACRAQDSLADDREGLLGLAGAFVANGVAEVVASPVDVDDELAPPVMATFHRHYRKHRSARVAFREAVLELLRSPSADLRSPAAWGGFTVIEGRL